jgi:hypothetical protein
VGFWSNKGIGADSDPDASAPCEPRRGRLRAPEREACSVVVEVEVDAVVGGERAAMAGRAWASLAGFVGLIELVVDGPSGLKVWANEGRVVAVAEAGETRTDMG